MRFSPRSHRWAWVKGNPDNHSHQAHLELGLPFTQAHLCDLGENRIERLYPDPAAPQTLEIQTPAKTILTLELS